MKGVTREGMDYEFTLVFELDMKNHGLTSKDRTSLFIGKSPFKITSAVGQQILEWCNSGGVQVLLPTEVNERINSCKSIGELLEFYSANPSLHEEYKDAFTKKKRQLTKSVTPKFSENGVGH